MSLLRRAAPTFVVFAALALIAVTMLRSPVAPPPVGSAPGAGEVAASSSGPAGESVAAPDVAATASVQLLGQRGPWFLGVPAVALEFCPAGTAIYALGTTGAVAAWDVSTGREVQRWTAHRGGAEGLGVVADGRVVTVGAPGVLRVWSASGVLEREVALSGRPAEVAVAGRRALVVCWPGPGDVQDGRRRVHGVDVDDGRVAFTEVLESTGTGPFARPVSGRRVVISSGGSAVLLDSDGVVLRRFDAGPGTHLFDATVDLDARWLTGPAALSPEAPHQVVVWDLGDDAAPRVVRPEPGAIPPFAALPLGEDGLLVLGGDSTQVWSRSTGRILATIPQTDFRPQHPRVDPTGRFAAWVEGSGQVRLLEITSLRPLPLPRGGQVGHHGRIESLAFSRDGAEVTSGGSDGKVCRWSTLDGALIASHSLGTWERPAALSYDRERDVLIGGRDVRLWAPPPAAPRVVIPSSVPRCSSLAWSPDGESFAIATSMHMRGWSAYAVQQYRLQGSTATLVAEASLDSTARSLHFTGDGEALVAAVGARLDVLRVPGLAHVRTIPVAGDDRVVTVAVHASRPWAVVGDDRGSVSALDLTSGDVLARFVAHEQGPVSAVGWAGDLIVTAGGEPNAIVTLWRDGRSLARWETGVSGGPSALAASLDARFVALGGYGDTRVTLWRVDAGLVR